jgi:hypothetical protein
MPNPFEEELARLRALVEQAHGWLDGRNAGVVDLEAEDRVEGHTHDDEDDGHDSDDVGMLFVESYRNVTSIPREFAKARKRPRTLAVIDTIVIHQTAVAGGFDLSKRMLDRHRGNSAEARQARYRDTPYHGVFSPKDQASIVQWPAWAHTFHGNNSNATSLGWAIDGKFPGDELALPGARAALRHFVIAMRDAGVPLRFVEAHRQHSAQRAADPGVEVWTKLVRPLLGELKLEERATRTTGTGLSLPPEWLTG